MRATVMRMPNLPQGNLQGLSEREASVALETLTFGELILLSTNLAPEELTADAERILSAFRVCGVFHVSFNVFRLGLSVLSRRQGSTTSLVKNSPLSANRPDSLKTLSRLTLELTPSVLITRWVDLS